MPTRALLSTDTAPFTVVVIDLIARRCFDHRRVGAEVPAVITPETDITTQATFYFMRGIISQPFNHLCEYSTG